MFCFVGLGKFVALTFAGIISFEKTFSAGQIKSHPEILYQEFRGDLCVKNLLHILLVGLDHLLNHLTAY